jgi:hypothetical protein
MVAKGCPLLDGRFLVSGVTQPVSGQQLGKHVHATIEQCFLCGPCREVITRTVGAMSSATRNRAKSAVLSLN